MSKKKVTRQQRKKLRMRAIKEEYGVEEFYFSLSSPVSFVRKRVIKFSRVNQFKEYQHGITAFINTLNEAKSGNNIILLDMDTTREYNSLYELREEILIRKIAGI